MKLPVPTSAITLNGLEDGEVIYQQCLLISGLQADSLAIGDDAPVLVTSKDAIGNETFPELRWPMCQGHFKGLVILSPGSNIITISDVQKPLVSVTVRLQYIPLLQTPPLHLAIMIAKDSPLLIDCPPGKLGAITSTHSSLNAAIAKLRVTACMWQALTAEEMRINHLERRSFRLEEEWGVDTLSQKSFNEKKVQSTIKVHLVPTEKTVAELRSMGLAQQNSQASDRDGLHNIFSMALKAYGGPFEAAVKPVVAGLILDSHYDISKSMILAHAALGAHDKNGLSLGIFGSHLTYSWPRFMEEIPSCLLDTTPVGEQVGNDNGECNTMWEACAVGQGAFMHEVGHAFSAPHSSGIMVRGYSPDWAQYFLSRTANSSFTDGVQPVTPETQHDCHWDVGDVLRFAKFPHFWHPNDLPRSDKRPEFITGDEDDDETDNGTMFVIKCSAGIAQVKLNKEVQSGASTQNPQTVFKFNLSELEQRFLRSKPLEVKVLAMNGNHRSENLWKLLANSSTVRVPGTKIVLHKKTIGRVNNDDSSSTDWPWVVMLKKRGANGSIVPAIKVDIRVGCALDGAIVYYKDGTTVPCGPRGKNGNDGHMGGHQARKLALPRGVEITKVAVTDSDYELSGLRMWLSSGKAMGALNRSKCNSSGVKILEPDAGQRILGFCGTSYEYGMCGQFGIVTGPADQEIPDSVYDMPELQNNPESSEGRPAKRRRIDDSQAANESEVSEDEDCGYDEEMDEDDY